MTSEKADQNICNRPTRRSVRTVVCGTAGQAAPAGAARFQSRDGGTVRNDLFQHALAQPFALESLRSDKHRGICLGFDVDDRGLKPVAYAKERPSLRVPPRMESINELLFTKFRDWSYEEELRNWFSLDEREGEHYFYPLDSLVKSREVIVGPLRGLRNAEIEKSLEEYSDCSQGATCF